MSSVRSKLWSGGYDVIPGLPKSFRKPHKPGPEWIRQQAKDSSEGGRFFCPGCHTGFSMTYATYGIPRSAGAFAEPTNYCQDCRCSLEVIKQ